LYRQTWLRAAAVILFVAAGSWLAYNSLSTNKNKLALETPSQKQIIVNRQLPEPAPSADSKGDSVVENNKDKGLAVMEKVQPRSQHTSGVTATVKQVQGSFEVKPDTSETSV